MLRSEIPHLEAVIARRVNNPQRQVRMHVDGRLHNERAEGARALAGLVVRFENALRRLDRKLAAKHEWIDEITRAEGELGKPFQLQDALHTAYATRKAINYKLAAAPPPAAAPVARTRTSQHPSKSSQPRTLLPRRANGRKQT
ncbi:hypothetical protein [Streptomyces sp. SID13031]|uniref:hypothetical protein n=1 Tax=Streptomyces sp. SID13031 TaxID=2706046 RepID=UPI0013C663F2|nr:hypothetical protein [Streptomyces sp. SID13031]NEA31253.1 hypothetical protein [Streptomyces sp. SID13031]